MDKKPIYLKDFFPGDVIFTKTKGSLLSGVISVALHALDCSGFDPSHVVIVQDEYWGIEAAESGVKWCRLLPVFETKQCLIARASLISEVQYEIVKKALVYYGRPYDFLGLVIGFPLQLLSGLCAFIPAIRKLPVPFHFRGSFVCSAFVAQVLKDTGKFKDVKLLTGWHVTRITPSMLLRDFPWRIKYEYSCVSTVDKPDVEWHIATNTDRPDNPYSAGSDEPHDVNDAHVDDEQGRQGV